MRLLISLVLFGIVAGCNAPIDDHLLVPGERAGSYVLGHSTLAQIMGEDTPANRQRFADQGINFEFDRGRKLKAVIVGSDKFNTVDGLRVGSSVDAVREQLGAPIATPEGEKVVIEVLAYPGIQFFPQDDRVRAIRIGPGT